MGFNDITLAILCLSTTIYTGIFKNLSYTASEDSTDGLMNSVYTMNPGGSLQSTYVPSCWR